MAKINTVLIGNGRWGKILARYLSADKHFCLAGICNSKSNLLDIWNDKSIKSVVIATPNETHYELTRAALSNDKHVMVEKPLAYRESECIILKNIAVMKRLALFTDYTWTFSRAINKMIDYVRKGKIGEPRRVKMQFCRYSAFDPLWQLGSHMLAILDILVPLNVNQFHVNGHIISFPYGFIKVDNHSDITKIEIAGDQGVIKYDKSSPFNLVIRSFYDEKDYQFDEDNTLRYTINGFYRAIKGKASNLESSIRVTKVLEQCRKLV